MNQSFFLRWKSVQKNRDQNIREIEESRKAWNKIFLASFNFTNTFYGPLIYFISYYIKIPLPFWLPQVL